MHLSFKELTAYGKNKEEKKINVIGWYKLAQQLTEFSSTKARPSVKLHEFLALSLLELVFTGLKQYCILKSQYLSFFKFIKIFNDVLSIIPCFITI